MYWITKQSGRHDIVLKRCENDWTMRTRTCEDKNVLKSIQIHNTKCWKQLLEYIFSVSKRLWYTLFCWRRSASHNLNNYLVIEIRWCVKYKADINRQPITHDRANTLFSHTCMVHFARAFCPLPLNIAVHTHICINCCRAHHTFICIALAQLACNLCVSLCLWWLRFDAYVPTSATAPPNVKRHPSPHIPITHYNRSPKPHSRRSRAYSSLCSCVPEVLPHVFEFTTRFCKHIHIIFCSRGNWNWCMCECKANTHTHTTITHPSHTQHTHLTSNEHAISKFALSVLRQITCGPCLLETMQSRWSLAVCKSVQPKILHTTHTNLPTSRLRFSAIVYS